MSIAVISERANEILEDTVRRVRSIKGGPGITVKNDSGGITITAVPVRIPQISMPTFIFDAKIVAAVAINGLIRWKYTIELGHWDPTTNPTTGGTWATSSTGTIYAFNEAESMNTFTSGTGTIGTGNTGVAQSTGAVGSCTLKPLANGDYVTVKFRYIDPATGQAYYTIINKSNTGQ